MTEYQWLTATEPDAMLEFLYPMRGLDSVESQSRMSRLYLLECARRAWNRLPGVCRTVVSLAEQVYQRKKTDRELKNVAYPIAEVLVHCRGEAEEINRIGRRLVDENLAVSDAVWVDQDFDPELWLGFAQLAVLPFASKTPFIGHIPSDLHSADLLREVFGNPFRQQPNIRNEWRSESVVQLASHARKAGDFSALPALADALEEAGCDRSDLLEHFRQRTFHARGCWAIDLVLQ